MSTTPQGASTPPPEHPTLSRERIVRAAVALVDEDGLGALSMRALGARLGVEAMALYRHVDGREDLLEAVVDMLTAAIPRAADMDLGPGGGWQAYLLHLGHEVRALAEAHPHLFPLVATRHPAAPWLRPPLRSLATVEDFLSTLIGFGFDQHRAVAAYRSFTSFLVGQLLLEVSQRGAPTTALAPELEEDGPGDEEALSAYPMVHRLRGELSEDRSDEEFARGLEHLLDRIERHIPG